MGCFRRLGVIHLSPDRNPEQQTKIYPLLSFDQEAEDEETVAVVSEKSVKTGEKGTTPAPPQIKLETRSAALGNAPVGKKALILLINCFKESGIWRNVCITESEQRLLSLWSMKLSVTSV